MSTVVGIFDSEAHAIEAIRALQEQGFSEEELSVVGPDKNKNQGNGGMRNRNQGDDFETGNMINEDLTEGVAWGGGVGALGGLLAGIGALAIPGIGPVIAAGPLATALSGAVAGGVAGGLIDLGIPEEESKRFEQDLKEGRLLAIVEAEDEELELAESIFRENGADEVQVYR